MSSIPQVECSTRISLNYVFSKLIIRTIVLFCRIVQFFTSNYRMVELILFFSVQNSWRGKELNKFCQTAATTFAFSFVCILLLWIHCCEVFAVRLTVSGTEPDNKSCIVAAGKAPHVNRSPLTRTRIKARPRAPL